MRFFSDYSKANPTRSKIIRGGHTQNLVVGSLVMKMAIDVFREFSLPLSSILLLLHVSLSKITVKK